MKIVMASSELAPFATSGRLGESVAGLAKELALAGHEVSVVVPYYRAIQEARGLDVGNSGVQFTIPMGGRALQAVVHEATLPEGVQLFLIGRDDFFESETLYGHPNDAERFIFFSRAVVELARHLDPAPDVLHLHDWQTALVAPLIRSARLPFRTLLSLYDVAYQGLFPADAFQLTGLPSEFFTPEGLEFHGQVNCLKGGILHADTLVTSSVRYAKAVQTPTHGCGLDGALKARTADLHGIPPGLDRALWNPAADPRLTATYDAAHLKGKTACRDRLLRELGLKPTPSGPTLAFFHTPATSGQTLDLLVPVLDRILVDDLRVVLLGERDPRFERDLRIAARQYPGKFAYRTDLDETLRHQIVAGADLLLLSSHPDPMGENSLIALAYGTLPVVRAAEGLHPVVQDYDPAGFGNGFVYHRDDPDGLYDALVRARKLFTDEANWQGLVARAMSGDFSWNTTARRIARLYGEKTHAA